MSTDDFLARLEQGIFLTDDDDHFFAAIIRDAPMTDKELSELFMVSRPSVERWRRAKATPHPLIKRRIYEVLQEKVRSGEVR